MLMIALHLMTEAALDKATIMISNGPCIPWEQAPTSYTALLFPENGRPLLTRLCCSRMVPCC